MADFADAIQIHFLFYLRNLLLSAKICVNLETRKYLNMWKFLKKQLYTFLNFNLEGDISHYFTQLLPKILILFLAEQLIVSYFDNTANFVTTLIAFIGYFIFLYIIKRYDLTKYRSELKLYIYLFTLSAVVVWWFSSAGLLGSIGYYFSFSVFACIVMFEEKQYKKMLFLPIIVFTSLSLIDIFFPNLPLQYSSDIIRRIDIFSAMMFSSLVIILVFHFLKRIYEKKETELLSQYETEKKLNEELDNFVYRTSHDLRAPVSSCLGLAEIALASQDIEEVHRYLRLQQRSLGRMDKFITDVLHYSRNHRLEKEFTLIDLNQIFGEMMEQVTYSKEAEGIICSFENKSTQPFYSDPLRLQMIFNNLISNAIRYHDKHKSDRFLKVTADFIADKWQITFEDNGIGIDAAVLPKIFDMFYRGTQHSDGSGVGLYIVKQALEKINGHIECESKLGIGTIFRVYLGEMQG